MTSLTVDSMAESGADQELDPNAEQQSTAGANVTEDGDKKDQPEGYKADQPVTEQTKEEQLSTDISNNGNVNADINGGIRCEGNDQPADEVTDDCEDHIEADSSVDPPSQPLDTEARTQLYERGHELHTKGKHTAALKSFLKCLSGLDGNNGFPYLPQCLRHIADIYYTLEEYEKAIQFIQAEKLYYETALVDTADIQSHLEEKRQKDGENPTDPDTNSTHPDLIRAEEYEGLAKMCLDRKQPQLALEYQAKATKLKQLTLGEEHPSTKRSLDFFTIVYGEVGKHQYSESVQKLTMPILGLVESRRNEDNESPTSELRHRKNKRRSEDTGEVSDSDTDLRRQGTSNHGNQANSVNQTEDNKAKSREGVHDTVETAQEIREKEEWISRALLLVLFGLCFVVLACTTIYLYCKLSRGSRSCHAWKADIHYQYMRFKYWYYSFTSDGKTYG